MLAKTLEVLQPEIQKIKEFMAFQVCLADVCIVFLCTFSNVQSLERVINFLKQNLTLDY